jgi:hypothetical protein
MAKDKSKKSGGFSDEFGKPSEAPAGGDGFKLTDDANVGRLLLITPLREDEHVDKFDKKGGTKTHIVADVVVIDEKKPEKSEAHESVWIFGGWLMGAIRGYIGLRRVVARLVQEDDKGSATGYVWKFEDGSAKDIEKARAYLASLDPFGQSKGATKADEKPAKKGAKGGKSKADEKPAKKGAKGGKSKADEKPAKKKSKK